MGFRTSLTAPPRLRYGVSRFRTEEKRMSNVGLRYFRFVAGGFIAVMIPVLGAISAQNPAATQPAAGPATDGLGLIRNAPGAYTGYTLVSPQQSTKTFLVDME